MESDSLAAVKKIPQRQCIGCNEMKDKKQLIRILKTQDEQIIIDTTGKKNGRGAYICPDASVLRKQGSQEDLKELLRWLLMHLIYDELEKEMNNLGTIKEHYQ